MDSTITSRLQDASLFATRAVIAFVFVWHGWPKAVGWGWSSEFFASIGLPGWMGPATGIAEVVFGALLAGGVLHRLSALSLAAIIVGAIATVQIHTGVSAELERDLLILVGSLVLATVGAGSWTLPRLIARARDGQGPTGAASEPTS